ncbi:V4R domain-containing protein [Methanospirillum stamsii]|uniref:4-vinyl reductase n=1 Tax=Methanospirillum stamsii TaxID=1277351 RepID=A0A2V2MX33_9EURY|nr:V4R domain-containing protein [Methanospirillum stamsii]PWR70790.1 4-vinyl reductase [Methanospirillum stamsii]
MAGEQSGTEPDADGEILLFSSKNRVMAIESEVKKKILELLQERDYSFDEIVTKCGKAKSTVSVHIRDLINAGLITSRIDPFDNRKKILTISAIPIGSLTNIDRNAPTREERLTESSTLPFTPGDIPSFFRWGVRLFRTEAMALGINVDPVLERTGWEMGTILAHLVYNPDLSGMVKNMSDFWQEHGLGTIILSSTDPVSLTVHGCFECEDLPITGHGTCSFDIGVLSAIFTNYFHSPVQITEVECYSAGDDHCRFIIKKNKTTGEVFFKNINSQIV